MKQPKKPAKAKKSKGSNSLKGTSILKTVRNRLGVSTCIDAALWLREMAKSGARMM